MAHLASESVLFYPRMSDMIARLRAHVKKRKYVPKVNTKVSGPLVTRARGEVEYAERHLENAFLTIPALENTFNMGHYAAKVSGLLRVWGREAEAREWDSFIGQLKTPQKTAGLFRERAARIVERSESRGRVFLC